MRDDSFAAGRLWPRRLLIARYGQASKRTTLSLSSPSARDPSAHATAQIDDQHASRVPSRCALARGIEAAAVRRRPRTRSDGFLRHCARDSCTPDAKVIHGRTSAPASVPSAGSTLHPRPPSGVQLLVTLPTTGSNYVSNGKLSGAATPVLPLSEVVHMKATFPPRHLGGFEASTEVSRGNTRAVAALYPPGEEV